MLIPMSPTDSMFLLAESASHPMHVGALQIFSPPQGGSADDVQAAFEESLGTTKIADVMHRKATRPLVWLGQWCWQHDVDFTATDHAYRHVLPPPAGMDELLTLCSRLHAQMLDRTRPLWEMHLIAGLADGRYAVYTKMHHAVADGVSAMRMLQGSVSPDSEQRGMDTAVASTTTPHAETPTGLADGRPLGLSRVLPGAMTRAAAGVRGVAGLPGEALGVLGALGNTLNDALHDHVTSLSLVAPHTMFNVPITAQRQFTARSWPIRRLQMVARSGHATVNDVVLAMCSGALRRYLSDMDRLPDDSLIAMVPVSLRAGTAQNGKPEGGNNLGVLMCNLATNLTDPASRLAAVRAGTLEGKQALQRLNRTQTLAVSALGLSTMALSLLPGYSQILRSGVFRPAFNLVISNVPGPTGPRYWNGARMDELYPLSIPTHGQALNITCTSTDDKISFGLTGCPTTMPDLRHLADYLEVELSALEHAPAA